MREGRGYLSSVPVKIIIQWLPSWRFYVSPRENIKIFPLLMNPPLFLSVRLSERVTRFTYTSPNSISFQLFVKSKSHQIFISRVQLSRADPTRQRLFSREFASIFGGKLRNFRHKIRPSPAYLWVFLVIFLNHPRLQRIFDFPCHYLYESKCRLGPLSVNVNLCDEHFWIQ